MTVKQSGDRIEIESHVKTPMGEQRIPDVYVLDGTEITLTAQRKWTLAPGGDTLTVEITGSSPQGEAKTTRVFARQQPAGG